MPPTHLFAGYPSALVFALDPTTPDLVPADRKAIKHLLWGDFMKVVATSPDGVFHRVKVRDVEGWIEAAHTQAQRLLEIVFVDIGQGDGALVVMPDDRKYVVDAGEGDNMHRFLRWRFGGFRRPVHFDAAVLSHSDLDHYGGFDDLFDEPNVTFDTVYTNGLMERKAASTKVLGDPVTSGGVKFITALVPDLSALQTFLATSTQWDGKKYPTMLNKALTSGRFTNFRMLAARDGHLPGHAPGSDVEVRVLGPWVEDAGGHDGLRWFGDVGKTKNGHSIVFRMVYGRVTIFMGGDLNLESCRLLLEKHTGLDASPSSAEDENRLVQAARAVFGCDIAKACHHGSADVLLPFMKALNPAATVVSSGDDEPHAHPRADALGAIGRCSRGDRPLIFSTELARSTKETIKHPSALRARLKELQQAIAEATSDAERERAQKRFNDAVNSLDRSVAVFGAINLRTDGQKVVMAYKLEQSKPTKGWDIYVLEPAGATGPLTYFSKYDG